MALWRALFVAQAVAAASTPKRSSVFVSGVDGYHTYRIPALAQVQPSGALLLFAEGRKLSSADHDWNDIVLKRSADGGATWESMRVVHSESTPSKHVTIGNPSPVTLRNGSIVLLFTRNNTDIARTASHDGGATWSPPQYLPLPDLSEWGPAAGAVSHLATGPPGGIELPWSGPGPGAGPGAESRRLVVPATFCRGGSKPMTCADLTYGASFVLLSDDGGLSWRASRSAVEGGNECQVALAPNGSLVLSMRSIPSPGAPRAAATGARLWSWSHDGGDTWTSPLTTSFNRGAAYAGGTCASSVVRAGDPPALLLSTPYAKPGDRANETVFVSRDSGASWKLLANLDTGRTAYSSLAALAADDLPRHGQGQAQGQRTGAAWEVGAYSSIDYVVLDVPNDTSV